jgi:NAD(P)-dependent dehydrogenase (short-subunit alcohol dehydrogenase family)
MNADATQELRGRTVVVTGASAGIGAVAARRFAERGATVAVVGRSPDKTAAADRLTWRTTAVWTMFADSLRSC